MLTTTQLAQKIDDWVFNRRDRQLLKARLLDGATFAELADMTDMSVNGVKSRYARALSAFEDAMQADGYQPTDYIHTNQAEA